MYISHAEILNYRALQSISIPLNKFSVLLGENDVGKTSFLYALEAFFSNKKITEKDNFFKGDVSKDISIALTFKDVPNNDQFQKIMRNNGEIIISKDFSIGKAPIVKALLDDESKCKVDKNILSDWFSMTSFHFIPVRRDLAVQFSMTKTALLGKTLRAKMKSVIEKGDASDSLENLQGILINALSEPQNALQSYLQEQLHNDEINFTLMILK